MAMYATGLWSEMDEAVQRAKHRRRVEDPASPMGAEVLEAEPGRSFELQDPTSNVPVQTGLQRTSCTSSAVARRLARCASTTPTPAGS